jgi:N-acetyl sugar amidotransferase
MKSVAASISSHKAQTCRRCLYAASHPLGLVLDEAGICSGCRIHEEKNTLDWSARWRKLESIVSPYRISSGKTYDCIVPVTGANDSYYIVYLVKERLRLNPLLVTYNKYFNTALGIRNLANLRIRFNCDILYQNINPLSVKKITRTTLRELGSIYWPCHAGQTVFPVQTAMRYKVPLIIWGAHQGVEQVGMYSHEHEVEMTRRYRKDHDLMGYEADDLLTIFDTLTEDDIWQFRYPSDSDLHSAEIRGIYLSNYTRWDPKAQHDEMVKRYQYQGARFARTFDTYDHVDCYNFMDLHDHIKMSKYGYSKVTDHACREIRHGRITRDQARVMVQYYEHQPLRYVDKFCDWLGVDKKSLNFIMSLHESKGDARRTYLNRDELSGSRDTVPDSLESTMQDLGYIAHSSLGDESKPNYMIFGKGYHE